MKPRQIFSYRDTLFSRMHSSCAMWAFVLRGGNQYATAWSVYYPNPASFWFHSIIFCISDTMTGQKLKPSSVLTLFWILHMLWWFSYFFKIHWHPWSELLSSGMLSLKPILLATFERYSLNSSQTSLSSFTIDWPFFKIISLFLGKSYYSWKAQLFSRSADFYEPLHSSHGSNQTSTLCMRLL